MAPFTFSRHLLGGSIRVRVSPGSVTEGRERMPSEYEALVKSAGFKTFAYRRTGRPLDVMLAAK